MHFSVTVRKRTASKTQCFPLRFPSLEGERRQPTNVSWAFRISRLRTTFSRLGTEIFECVFSGLTQGAHKIPESSSARVHCVQEFGQCRFAQCKPYTMKLKLLRRSKEQSLPSQALHFLPCCRIKLSQENKTVAKPWFQTATCFTTVFAVRQRASLTGLTWAFHLFIVGAMFYTSNAPWQRLQNKAWLLFSSLVPLHSGFCLEIKVVIIFHYYGMETSLKS